MARTGWCCKPSARQSRITLSYQVRTLLLRTSFPCALATIQLTPTIPILRRWSARGTRASAGHGGRDAFGRLARRVPQGRRGAPERPRMGRRGDRSADREVRLFRKERVAAKEGRTVTLTTSIFVPILRRPLPCDDLICCLSAVLLGECVLYCGEDVQVRTSGRQLCGDFEQSAEK